MTSLIMHGVLIIISVYTPAHLCHGMKRTISTNLKVLTKSSLCPVRSIDRDKVIS